MSGIASGFFLTNFWDDQLVAHDKQWIFLVLLGLIVSFGFIRLSTRLMRSPRVPWWPGSIVSEGGVHIHHLVFGIVLMMLAGAISFTGFATSPLYEICAFTFGVGIGLTIDEFALWVYLDDVYWKEQGRASVDAAVLAVAFLGLVLIGIRPVDLAGDSVGAVLSSILTIAFSLAMSLICLLKQRLWHGAIGLFLPPLAIYGAARLGKPESAWAKRRYGDRDPGKQDRSRRRFPPDRRSERLKRWLQDAIGGAPEPEYEAKIAARR